MTRKLGRGGRRSEMRRDVWPPERSPPSPPRRGGSNGTEGRIENRESRKGRSHAGRDMDSHSRFLILDSNVQAQAPGAGT